MADRHAFIIRIWRETAGTDQVPAVWRGQVVHVPSGAQRYVQTWREVLAFIEAYLDASPQNGGPGSADLSGAGSSV